MKPAVALIGVAAVAGASCAASARDTYKPTGSRIGRPAPAVTPHNTNNSNEDNARRVTNDFASCIYRTKRAAVNEALATVPESEAADAALEKLIRTDCYAVAGDLQIPHSLLRGALFRAKFINEFRWKDVALAAEPIDYEKFVPSPLQPQHMTYVALGDFADCDVRGDLAGTRKFVEQEAGSDVETDALNALVSQLVPCLSDGLKVSFSKSSLQALLAEALYHQTTASTFVQPQTEAASVAHQQGVQ